MNRIGELARTHPYPLVVMGDLNTTPFSAHYRGTLRAGVLRSCVRGSGLVPTWPTWFPLAAIPIDHCLATADVRARSFRVGRNIGSDHYPISVDVSLKPAALRQAWALSHAVR